MITDTVLFEFNKEWVLIDTQWPGYRWKSQIRHFSKRCTWYTRALDTTKCKGCRASIPEELIALWKLHNWETIQGLDPLIDREWL